MLASARKQHSMIANVSPSKKNFYGNVFFSNITHFSRGFFHLLSFRGCDNSLRCSLEGIGAIIIDKLLLSIEKSKKKGSSATIRECLDVITIEKSCWHHRCRCVLLVEKIVNILNSLRCLSTALRWSTQVIWNSWLISPTSSLLKAIKGCCCLEVSWNYLQLREQFIRRSFRTFVANYEFSS